MFKLKPTNCIDSYKLGHVRMNPEGTSLIYANWTPRSDTYLNLPNKNGKIVWLGGQAVVRDMVEFWQEEFFGKNFDEVKEQFASRIRPFIGDNEFDFDLFRDLHSIGYLPFKIKALPEGSVVDIGIPCMTFRNTLNDEFGHLSFMVNYIESYFSAEAWKIATTATIAHGYRRIIDGWADATMGDKFFVNFQGHDFSYRGMGGSIDSAKAGVGHLASFLGTDVVSAVDYVEYHYGSENNGLIGCSVPASEHSVTCLGGEENEIDTIRRFITELYPTGVVSVVSDTWDYWDVLTNKTKILYDDIVNRKPDSLGLAKVVFRPDSGDPVKIIAGYTYTSINMCNEAERINAYERGFEAVKDFATGKYFKAKPADVNGFVFNEELPAHEVLGSVQVLWDIFGGTINEKGYKTLNQRVGLIYGDSITPQRAEEIFKRLKDRGFASDNIVFGIGSYTYQFITRDTLGWAMKTTYGEVNGKPVNVAKNPKTDSGTKKSAKGLLRVEYENDKFVLYDQQTWEQEGQGMLRVCYENGKFYNVEDFKSIRDRLTSFRERGF